MTQKEIEEAHRKLDEVLKCADETLAEAAIISIECAYEVYRRRKSELELRLISGGKAD